MNAIFLMFQSFIPFPTAIMGEYATNPLAVSFFGLVMAVNTILFILMHRYVLRHLIKLELGEAQDPRIIAKSCAGVVSYLLGAAAAWLSVHMAFAIYLVTPLFFIVPPQRAIARQTGPGADAA
jgi:TMEM175 potassium channel family protein